METPEALADAVARFAAGTGPVAVDAERASGYRYSQRAYLVQLRREGAGTVLIDPLPLGDLRPLDAAIADAEWVLHAASQDLPCLAELGMRPRRLFDTELAARLAGFERVGLAALTEQLLGFTLEKHHSAADWSTRPLPESWLTYAALDVELLTDLRDALAAELIGRARRRGRRRSSPRWSPGARAATGRAPDPWRRTSGIHRVRGARGPGPGPRRCGTPATRSPSGATRRRGGCCPTRRSSPPRSWTRRDERTLLTLPGFGGRSVRRLARTWLDALDEARRCPTTRCRSTRRWTGRPRRTAGPSATRWRRPGWPAAARW